MPKIKVTLCLAINLSFFGKTEQNQAEINEFEIQYDTLHPGSKRTKSVKLFVLFLIITAFIFARSNIYFQSGILFNA